MGNKYNLSASPPFQKVPPSMLVNSLSSRHEHTYSGANNLPLHQNWVIQSKESFSYPWKKIFSKKVRWPGAVEGACNWIVRVWRRFESNLKKVIIKTSSIPELWYGTVREKVQEGIFFRTLHDISWESAFRVEISCCMAGGIETSTTIAPWYDEPRKYLLSVYTNVID